MLEARYIPDGWPTLVPRIFVDEAEALVGFIQRVFGATGSFQRERRTELRIGDSMLMVSASLEHGPMPAFLYVYVPDADATHHLALDAGATSLEPPSAWQIATHGGRFR